MAWQGRLIGQGVAMVVFGFLAIYWLKRDNLLKRPSNLESTVNDALKFGLPLIPHALGGLALAGSGQIVTNAIFGASDAGYYAVAVQLGAVVGLFADAFVKVYGPWLYGQLNNDDRENKSFIVGVTYVIFLFFALASAMIAIALVLIIPYFLGAKFAQAQYLVPVIVFGYGLTGMYYAIAGFFFFTSNTKFVSVVTLLSGALMVGAMFVLAGYFGAFGVALGFAIGQLVMLFLAIFVSNRIYPMPWLKLRLAYVALANRLAHK
jgi:O-antigen/teichoic acid export membrane protein